MSFNPIDDNKPVMGAMSAGKMNELPEIDLAEIDFKEIEKKASIFVKDTKSCRWMSKSNLSVLRKTEN